MKIQELVSLTNGLSVTAATHTLVCDRARVVPVSDTRVDMSFWIVGTDLVPRLSLPLDRLTKGTPDEVADIIRLVARGAITGERHPRG